MRKLDVGPTIDAASWRSVDGGVYARGPRGGILLSFGGHDVSCEVAEGEGYCICNRNL